MAEGKFTPPPWESDGEGNIYSVADGQPVAFVAASRMTQDDLMGAGPATANARLIAAAPELLEALKAILPLCEFALGEQSPPFFDQVLVDAAHAAILKATVSGAG